MSTVRATLILGTRRIFMERVGPISAEEKNFSWSAACPLVTSMMPVTSLYSPQVPQRDACFYSGVT